MHVMKTISLSHSQTLNRNGERLSTRTSLKSTRLTRSRGTAAKISALNEVVIFTQLYRKCDSFCLSVGRGRMVGWSVWFNCLYGGKLHIAHPCSDSACFACTIKILWGAFNVPHSAFQHTYLTDSMSLLPQQINRGLTGILF